MGKLTAATFLIGMVLSVLSACNNSQNAAPTISDDIATVVKSASVETECVVVKGVDKILSDKAPPIIIVGEIHGYKGAPSLVKALLCHATKRGINAHLALEFSRNGEAQAQSFIKSNGSKADYRTILSDSRWLSLSDGRHTSATFGLLEYLQALPSGEKIDVSYFVPSSNEMKALSGGAGFAKNYEIALADNLKSIFQRYNPDKMIVLIGNLHAMRGEARFGGATYLTMASHFSHKEAVSLNTSNILGNQFAITLTPDEEGRYDGTYGVENNDAAPAVPSPFR